MDSRISVSEDKLRSMFAELKLDLFTKLQEYATIVALNAVEKRLDDLRTHNEERIQSLERWRASQDGSAGEKRRIAGGTSVWVGILVAIGTAIILLYAGNH